MNDIVKQMVVVAAFGFSVASHANLPKPSICPKATDLQCMIGEHETGIWYGLNKDQHKFATKTEYTCDKTAILFLPKQSDMQADYKVKCTYRLTEDDNIPVIIALYNELDYKLCPNKTVVGKDEFCQ